LQIPADIREYEKNRQIPAQWIPDGYRYGYETNIYPTNRIQESYYPYPTRSVDIPNYYDFQTFVIYYSYLIPLYEVQTIYHGKFNLNLITLTYNK